MERMKHWLPGSFNDSYPKRILLIGAGGTGSQILTDLARMNQTLISLGHTGYDVIVTDPDVVTTTNVGRQLYSMSDVGQYKSVVLTTRLNMFYGTSWTAYTTKVDKNTNINERLILVITAVDSSKTRIDVGNLIKRASIPYWLDTGNTSNTGNVILGNAEGIYSRQPPKGQCIERLPNVIDLYGDVLKSAANEAIQPPSCSIAASLKKQDLFINKAVSTFAMQILWNCFRKGYIEQHGAFINLDTMNVRALDINPETWKSMGWEQKKPFRRKYAK